MSYIGSSPKVKRTRFTAQSADPGSPVAGDVFYSNGTPRAAGLWSYNGTAWKRVNGTPGITKVLSGSGNYTTPDNVTWLRVRIAGAGGGGAGSGTAVPSAASNGTSTTFGVLTAAFGTAGAYGNNGGAGGVAALGGAPGLAFNGTTGGASMASPIASLFLAGGNGGSSAFGGGGGPGGRTSGFNAGPNSGSGGGGAGTNGVANSACGSGGGSGACVEAYFYPTAGQVYAFAVGVGGAGGGAGTSGFAGGTGSDGFIFVEEGYD